MATRTHDISIAEAVERLSSLADLELDRAIGVSEKHENMAGDDKVDYRTVRWLHEKNATSTIHIVRETFRVILHHLRQFYKKDQAQVTDQKTLDGIKTIMVLVGEAAKKLDKCAKIFKEKQRITDLREYKQLQEFYKTKIAKKLDDNSVSKWISGLAHHGLGKENGEITFHAAPEVEGTAKVDLLAKTKHVYVDLETMKKDSEYELFLIRKEDGSRFFSPRLLRNIKLVCDFGSYFGEKRDLDPLEGVKQWFDRVIHASAKEIMKALGSKLDLYYHEHGRSKEYKLVQIVNKTLMALFLSSHSRNLIKNQPIKSCTEYFIDFQMFLREALQNDTYQRWITYPPKESFHLACDVLDLLHTLSRAYYTQLKGLEEMKTVVMSLIQDAAAAHPHDERSDGVGTITSRIDSDYEAMSKLIKHHPNGPLFKMIEILEDGSHYLFDPLLQHNIPSQQYELFDGGRRYAFLRIPAPITQEFIHKATVNPEFRAFLRSMKKEEGGSKHFIISMQDRTSWREYVRCKVLEDLQIQSDVVDSLDVVTLAVDTEFYHQEAPYNHMNHADQFKKQFKEVLLDDTTGYYFPSKINRRELAGFIDQAFEVIHQLFFSAKNVLSKDHRVVFIEIFYLLLELKLIEWLKPTTVSLTCKDAVDTGEAASIAIFAFLKIVNGEEWSEADWAHFNLMLYGPSLLVRERLMIPERFSRMLSALRLIENASGEMGKELFSKAIAEHMKGLFASGLGHAQIRF